MSDADDITIEPIEGLPEAPPAGEEILWQGRPNWRALARESLLLNWVAGYFVLLAVWQVAASFGTMPFARSLYGAVPYVLLGTLGCGIIALISYVQARSTVYTITSARVIMRIGAALTLTLNLPFREIANASLDLRKSGTGTVALTTAGKTRISYLVLWPHVRPWKINPAQPALRCINDARAVADLLADAADARVNEPQVERIDPSVNPVAAE